MSGDILDTIDGALADWELSSPDAMRWVPEQDRSETLRQRRPVRFYSTPDQHSYGLVQVAPVGTSPYAGLRERAERGQLTDAEVEQVRAALRVLTERLRPAVEAWQRSITAAVKRLNRATQADYTLMPPPPASDPRERALQARRNRYTGPQPDRLDGRRRRG